MRRFIPWLIGVLLASVFLPGIAFAQEGTKQFMPNSTDRLWLEIYRANDKYFATYNASDKERLYIYLNAGETMHFGMKMANYADGNENYIRFRLKDPNGQVVYNESQIPASGDAGYIENYSQAVNGPDGVKLNNVAINSGYDALTYTATESGDHYIEFHSWSYDWRGRLKENARFALEFFDVTVTDAANNVLTNPGQPNVSAGRLWSKGWAFTTTSYTNYPVKADFFVFTADEFVNKVQYEMKPYSFNFVANSYGVSLNVNDNVIEKAQSQDGDLTNTTDISEYRIFLNDPDRSVWQNTALPPPTVKVWFDDNLIYDYDYDRQPQELTLPPTSIVLEKNNVSCPYKSITMFKIESNIDGFATVLLDLDGNGYSTSGNDRALQLDLKLGTNYVLWDFKNDNGVVVGDGSYTASATFLGRGPAHFPLYDVESLSGISTYSIRPFNKLGPTLYWDDTQIGSWGDPTGNGSMDETVRKQLTINNHVSRVWIYDQWNSAYNGNGTTMNSWFNAIDLGMPLINFDVVTSTSKCVNGEAPVLGDVHLVAGIDEVITFNLADFTDKYYDPNDLPLSEIRILTLPADGSLKLSGVAITAGQIIPGSQIQNITYTPPAGFGGKYTFEFTASNGTNYALQSSVGNLVSNSAPTISAISDQTICTNEGLLSFPITVGDAETPVDDLTVIAYSHDQNAVENSGISLSGTGANRSLNVVPIPDQSGYAIIYVLVDDGYSQSIEEFALHIGPSVLFTGDVSVCVGGTLSLTAEEVGATYSWKKGSTVLSTSQNLTVSNLTLADAGTYSLSVTKGGCSITKEFEVSIAPIVSFTGDVALCVGEDLSLSADETVATNYTWKRGTSVIGSSKVLSKQGVDLADTGSDYTLEVTKEGCSNASAPFTISVINVLNNALTVSGSQVVENTNGTIAIQGAEQDVVYTAFDANNNAVAVGTGSNANLSLTVPVANLEVGNNVFTITGDNGNCTVDLLSTASITINALPVVSSQTISTNEDVAFTGNLLTGATDEDGGVLSAETTPVVPPVNGTVSIAANGNFTYTPNPNFSGSDSFTFRICDDQTPNGCVTADVSITVNAVNDVPVLSAINISTAEDVELVFAANDFTAAYSDEEGEALTKIQITSLPNASAGQLQLQGNPVALNQEIEVASISSLKFVPAANWNGSTSFQWNGSDGTAYAATAASIAISVTAQDDLPNVVNATASVIEGAVNNSVLYDVNDQLSGNDDDIDGEKITYSIVSGNTTNAFKVDTNTGEVAVNTSSAIDYETQTTYSITIRATDSNGGFSDLVLTVNVQNSDDDVVLTIADASLIEGTGGSSNLLFTVTASQNVAAALSFNFAVAEGTATYPEDYSVEAGTGVINAGTNTTTFSVPVVGDNVVEASESFTVSLNALSAGITSGTATGTITDNDNATLTIADASASEGAGQMSFDVTLNGTVQDGLVVAYNLTDGTASSGSDYNGANGTITFTGVSGQKQQVVVPVSDDNVVEPSEAFTIALSSANAAITIPAAATGTITDNDGIATLTIADQTVDENGISTFTVAVDKAVQGGFTVNYNASNETAINGTDFNIIGTSLSFLGTELESKTFTVEGIEDVIVEGSETFKINLSSTNSLVNSTDKATGTVIDNDAAIVTVENVSVTEGETAVFTLTLNKAVVGGTTITYQLTDDSSEKGVDYTEEAIRTVVFAGTAGESHTFNVTTKNDDVVESTETFAVSLVSSNTLVGADDVATGTITDNDGTATVSINNVSVAEGDNAQFTLTLDKAVQGGVVINYSTNNVEAIAGEDYTANSGSVTFVGTEGENQTITVFTTEDLVVENNENFTITLTESHALVNAAVSAIGTITNDDGQATISIANASFDENGTGTFAVTTDKAVQGAYVVNYTFEDGSAQAGIDFENTITPLNFTETSSKTQYITIKGIDDNLLEGPETFTIKLSAVNPLVIANSTATATINDNDAATITVADVTVAENETATFTITLDNAVQGGFTVDYTFTNGTAIGGEDFATVVTPVSFAGTNGETQIFTVAIQNDQVVENDETFTVGLSSSNALLDDSDTAMGTIKDNDGPATVSVADVVVIEGAGAEVVLQLNKAVQGGFSVNYSTVDGTATAGEDYVVKSGVASFTGAANETQSFFVDGKTDLVVEGDENFTINFSTLSSLVSVQKSSEITITDDDGKALITVEDISLNENGSGIFTLKADKAVQGGYTINYRYTDETAIGALDYNNTAGSVVFTGVSNETKEVVVAAINDQLVELPETFTIALTASSALVDASDVATATILDDDNASLTISDVQVVEGVTMNFVVTLTQAVVGGTTATCTFTDLTAVGGVDYNNLVQELVFAGTEGEQKTLSVSLTDDQIVETNETFRVALSSSNVLVDDSQTAVGTILNNDGTATITVADVNITEADKALIMLQVDKAVQGGFKVAYATANGTAIAGSDYNSAVNELTFDGSANQTQTIEINTIDDEVIESGESYVINYTSNSVLATVSAFNTINIADNDGLATLSVSNVSVSEGGTQSVTLTLDKAVQGGFEVSYQFVDVDTDGTNDYEPAGTPIVFAGVAGETQTIDVKAKSDAAVEGNETFTINYTPSVAHVQAADASVVTIIDGNSATLYVSNVAVNENETMTFSVYLNNEVPGGFVVDYTLLSLTATEGDDFKDTGNGYLTFAGTAKETQEFTVAIVDDNIVEANEAFKVTLSSRNSLVDDDDTAMGSIVDNDGVATISVEDITVNENQQAVFTLVADKAVQRGYTIDYQTATGTASSSDFTATSGTVSFAGTLAESQTITIDLLDDAVVEADETFTIGLTTANTLISVAASAQATISDNDGLVTLTVADISFVENASGTFVVKADKAVQGGFELSYSLPDGTAVGGVDFNNTTNTVSFAGNAGEEQTITVAGIDDTEVEADETFTLKLSSTNALVDASAVAKATITDDEVGNRIPVASDDAFNTDEDNTLQSMDVLANDTGLDDGGIVVTIVAQPTNALVSVNADNTLKLIPGHDYNGEVSFTYQVCDTDNDCATATVTVTINPVNDAPVLLSDIATVNQDEVLSGTNLLANDSDLENDVITINTTPVVNVTNGTLVINTDGTYTYKPNAGFFGEDGFTYEACDNGSPSLCSEASVQIIVKEVKPVNNAPVAVEDVYETGRNEVLNASSVLENDTDEDGHTLYVMTTLLKRPENGTVSIEPDGTFIYTPKADFVGVDSFVYQVCDDATPSACASATVTIAVVVKDSDGDFIPDDVEGDGDPDNDGDPNYLDEDSDGDGYSDKEEGLDDCDNDGVPNYLDTDLCYEEYPLSKGFSPNGDGINDLYEIPWLNQFTQVSIEVFNRWGNVVYTADKYTNDWDGTSNAGFTIGDELPVGTYFYIVTIKDTKQVIKGYIYLNR